ncbi:hypothetical protein A0H81_10123 [Grifola frondosa]|uniref:Methyltransferase domain-containing protein n=1 Tax=Grifola frondosa TaxID=5627 RepID=A0A1C7LZM7_GRIFR|nr:hypothetical protein A0H81_10123 [Grifola frondosa]
MEVNGYFLLGIVLRDTESRVRGLKRLKAVVIITIAEIYPHEPEHLHVVVGQIEERVQLIKAWSIQPGERVLEIGCGQGDCTAALAVAVGEKGSVTAVDPASLDYGSPYTLGEAQAHLRASPVGSRITFVQADPVAFLGSTTETYTTAVLAHCTWYFASPAVLSEILSALALRVERICIAEWALSASDARSVPHVLATFAQVSLECRKSETKSNIRTVLSPAAMRAAAAASRLTLQKEETVVPGDGMLDAQWEVGLVLSQGWAKEVERFVESAREKAVVFAARDAVRAAVDLLKGEKVRAMDVWVATFAKE